MKFILNEESDAALDSDSDATWISVGDLFSVYIRRTDDGVVVDIYAREREDCDCLASCYAFKQDAIDMQKGEVE